MALWRKAAVAPGTWYTSLQRARSILRGLCAMSGSARSPSMWRSVQCELVQECENKWLRGSASLVKQTWFHAAAEDGNAVRPRVTDDRRPDAGSSWAGVNYRDAGTALRLRPPGRRPPTLNTTGSEAHPLCATSRAIRQQRRHAGNHPRYPPCRRVPWVHRGPSSWLIDTPSSPSRSDRFRLPKLNGHELGGHLGVDCPGIPIIYTSAHQPGNIFRRDAPSGARFLQKPFSLDARVAAARSVLGAKPVPGSPDHRV
jgi:hypothetical protein